MIIGITLITQNVTMRYCEVSGNEKKRMLDICVMTYCVVRYFDRTVVGEGSAAISSLGDELGRAGRTVPQLDIRVCIQCQETSRVLHWHQRATAVCIRHTLTCCLSCTPMPFNFFLVNCNCGKNCLAIFLCMQQ